MRTIHELWEGEPPGTALLGRQLAEQADIPANYLSKVLLALRNAGILATARGTGGGYKLLKPANEIHLIDVVEIFDSLRAKPLCLLGQSECSDDAPCSAHYAWREVRGKFIDFLEKTTLDEISWRRGLDEGKESAT